MTYRFVAKFIGALMCGMCFFKQPYVKIIHTSFFIVHILNHIQIQVELQPTPLSISHLQVRIRGGGLAGARPPIFRRLTKLLWQESTYLLPAAGKSRLKASRFQKFSRGDTTRPLPSGLHTFGSRRLDFPSTSAEARGLGFNVPLPTNIYIYLF